jgi:hypothetical protein
MVGQGQRQARGLEQICQVIAATLKNLAERHMKTKFDISKSLGGYLRWGVAAATALLSCALPLQTRAAAFASPVGTWDVVMSARHQGLASITFNDDGTFSVASILVPKVPKQPSTTSGDDDRGTGGDDSRNGGTGGSSGSTATNTLPAHTNIFGFGVIPRPDSPPGTAVEPGQWGFDSRGRLVGFYTDVSGYSVCVTNTILVNTDFGVTTNNVVDCTRVTNAISFVGTVVPGKRLTVVASTPDGKSVFTGVPVTTTGVPDISGQWAGTKLDAPLVYSEFFTLTRNDPSDNTYAIIGAGPGYNYAGIAILSKSGRFGFAAQINPPTSPSDTDTDVHIRAVVGTLNKRKPSFHTTGLDETSNDPENRIRFSGARISAPD